MMHTGAFLAGAVVGMLLYFFLFPNTSVFFRRQESSPVAEEKIVRKLLDTFYREKDLEDWRTNDLIDFKKSEDNRTLKDNDTVARILQSNIKVLCIVFVNEHSSLRHASAVTYTWVKRCSSFIYIGKTPTHPVRFPIVKSNFSVYTSNDNVKLALSEAISYIKSKNFDTNDWILLSTDNTFVIMENLRYFLSNKNSSDAVYAGKISRIANGFVRPSQSGVVVLSKKTLSLLNRTSIELCTEKDSYELTKLLCLSRSGFIDKTPIDNDGTSLMNILPIKHTIRINAQTGKNILGNPHTVSMRFLSYQNIYSYEMLVYRLKPYGIIKS